MQARMYETEKVVKIVTKLLKHFDNGNRGNTTYINTYRLSKYLATISKEQGFLISTKTIRQVYEVLECITQLLGGWHVKGRYKWVFAIPHEALAQMSNEEIVSMILRCMYNE
jgi:hypothetical protein